MMAKGFKVEAKVKNEWITLYEDTDNYPRLRHIKFDEPVKAKELRLVVTSTWGAEQAHIFAFDAK